MNTKPLFIAMMRYLGALLITGVSVFQSACTPTQTALPVTSQRDEAGASSVETVVPIARTVAPMLEEQEVERPSGGSPKLESSLNQLLEAYEQGGLVGVQAFAEMHRMVLDEGRVQVEVVVAKEAMTDLREAVEAVGGVVQGHHETLLQALVPLESLESLAQRPDVAVIREPRRAGP